MNFCKKFKGIIYRSPDTSWKELLYIDDPLCRHISDLSPKEWSSTRPLNLTAVKCHDCEAQLPDLWICLMPYCGYIGCGRGEYIF